MAKIMQNRIWILLALLLVVTACGRKEAPQIVSDGQLPQLIDLQYEARGMVLKLDFSLAGSPEGVGYQVDRAEIDPYCKCPGLWRRYLEELPTPNNIGVPITKLLKLRTPDTELAFRLRAVDTDGQLGPWSKHLRVTGIDLFDQ